MAMSRLFKGLQSWVRWMWRQLTSMRVALLLLLLLAIAAIPGSLLPQRGADPNGVTQFQQDHPKLFPVLDAFPIQAFDVYSSVWFSAIYLLLFISLIGCVLPRAAQHLRALRGQPPRTPRRLARMVGFQELFVRNAQADGEARLAFAEHAVKQAAGLLRKRHYRVVLHDETYGGQRELSVSAERGYLRETGNLLFHVSLIGVLVGVAYGGLHSFNGQKLLVEGETMVNQLIDYDSVTAGSQFSSGELEPFSMRLNSLAVKYVPQGDSNQAARGQVESYVADVSLIQPDAAGEKESSHEIRVNHPLRATGSPIYLVSNGYAPHVVIKNSAGEVVFDEKVPFIPQDNATMTSLGVIKVPFGMLDAAGKNVQLGFRGFFYPTKEKLPTGAYTSSYPDLADPLLTLDVFVGDLGLDSGVPQSVYTLNTDKMKALTGRTIKKKSLQLTPGQTVQLPQGLGTITLTDIPRYASFDLMRNPGQYIVLVSALLAVLGLVGSLFVPRRRMWVKAVPVADGVRLEYAALARGDDPTLVRAVAELLAEHRKSL